jgi:hypothetical protein
VTPQPSDSHERRIHPGQQPPPLDGCRIFVGRPVVDEQLEVEFGRQPARVAIAGAGLVDAAQAASEGDLCRLDGVEQERPLGSSVLDEEERGVPFELRQAERRLQPADDRLEEVAGDGRRVLDLAP